MDFTDKLVVVTGVGRAGQVGEAIALGFAQRGATLALLDRQLAEVESRAASLRESGFHATAYAGDFQRHFQARRGGRHHSHVTL